MATKPTLYRWKSDPAGKKAAHTIAQGAHRQHLAARPPAPAKPKLNAVQRWRRRSVVQGSSMTNKQASAAAKGAVATKYGPLDAAQKRGVGEAQTWQHDVGGYYDQYLKQLAEQSSNVQKIGAQANAAMAGLQGGVTGLANADQAQLQGAAGGDAAQRGTQAANLAPLASSAAAVRQGILGSFGSQQAGQNAAANRYASGQAHVVGPGQKLQAVAQAGGRVRDARQKVADTAREKGTYRQQYLGDLRASESKNVLATTIATGKSAADQAKLTETIRTHKANEGNARRGQNITRAGQKAARNAAAGKVNAYGYSDKDWRAMSPAQRQSEMARVKKLGRAGSGGKNKKSGLLPPGQAAAGVTNAAQLKGLVQKARSGQPFVAGHAKQKPLNRGDAAKKILDAANVRNPVLLSAALDAVYGTGIGPVTARRLRIAGYRPSEVAAALGTTVDARPHFHGTRGG